MSKEERERRERIRAQMRDYYNIAESPTGKASSEPRAAASAESTTGLALDSETFDVNKFTTQLLQHESLKGLFEKDTQLRRKIRELDGKLQENVYENYSKFIVATETVRQMKDNVTDMDTKLKALSSNVENIDNVSKVISDNLKEHREKIESMMVLNRTLRKVQFLVELPEAMNKFIEVGKYHNAVKFWAAGDGVLSRHNSLQSFASTHEECRGIAIKLYNILDKTVKSSPLDSFDNVETVRQAVVDMRAMRATSLFQGVSEENAKFNDILLAAMMNGVKRKVDDAVKLAKDGFAKQVADMTLGESIPVELKDKPLQNLQLRELFSNVKTACAVFTSDCEKILDILGETDATNNLPLRITAGVQPLVIDLCDTLTKHIQNAALATLRAIIADCHKSTPEAVKEVLLSSLSGYGKLLKQFIQSLKALGQAYLDTSAAKQSDSFAHMVDNATKQTFVAVLSLCESFAETTPVVRTAAERNAYCKTVLFVALIAKSISRYTLLEIVANNVANFDTAPLKTAFHDAHKALTAKYIQLTGQCQTTVASAALEGGNWQTKSDPTAVSGYALLVVEEWKKSEDVLRSWFPTEQSVKHVRVGSGAGSTLSHNSSDAAVSQRSNRPGAFPAVANFTRREHSTILADVSHALAKTVSVLQLQPTTLDATHILECCVLYFVKTLVEHVRVMSFNRGGFQQLQVDLAFLLATLATHTGAWFKKEDQRIISLVHEVACSAYERTSEKLPLPPANVTSLVKATGSA